MDFFPRPLKNINAEYNVYQYGTIDNDSTPKTMAAISTVTSEGDGTGTYEGISNSLDDQDDLGTGSFTYAVSDDGQITFDDKSMTDEVSKGAVSSDGSLLVWVSYDSSDQSINFAVKESADDSADSSSDSNSGSGSGGSCFLNTVLNK